MTGQVKLLKTNGPSERIYFNWNQIKKTQFVATHMHLHLERYVWAFKHVRNKIITDVGCGTCYGSWILSIAAKKIFMIDYDIGAIEYNEILPFCCEKKIIVNDIHSIDLPKCDITVAFEFIEHLKDPSIFLKKINSNILLWSIPINVESEYHLINFKDIDEFLECLNCNGWRVTNKIEKQALGENILFYHGVAIR